MAPKTATAKKKYVAAHAIWMTEGETAYLRQRVGSESARGESRPWVNGIRKA